MVPDGGTGGCSGGHGDKNGGFQIFSIGECNEVANKRIIDNTPKQNPEQMKVGDTMLKLRPFGLKLSLSRLADSMNSNNQTHSNQAVEYQNHPKVNDYMSQPISEKLKAANFEATFLRIGKWERRKRNEGDLVAKCYFAKKKLVWEFLEGNLKNKIELMWSDIIGMRAFIQDHKPGILEIELNKPPAFFEEMDPQPRKHTIWKLTTDFTGGEASSYRRHYLVFPAGTLDKHYEKLLQCDERLYGLNQKTFPSQKTPYFETFYNTLTFSSDYRSGVPSSNLALHFNFASAPSPLMPTHPPSFNESTSPISDDVRHVFDNRRSVWAAAAAQGISSDLPPIPPLMDPLNAAVSCQNNNLPSSVFASNMVNTLLTNLEQHLFSDKQIGAYDEKYHMARVQSLNALLNLSQFQEESLSEDSSQQTIYDGFGGQLTVNNSQQPVYQQQQVALYPESYMIQQAWENMTYNCGNFGQDNRNEEDNHWN